ncbi:hypothetical protein ABZY93_21970 [Streptomyces smyrnaeus]|uniref:hypothetical protein n=1 Tax=Streptomyces smyrnaeus TaxID=1387713 RepID=UPI0033B39971
MMRRIEVYGRVGECAETNLGSLLVEEGMNDSGLARLAADFYRGIAAALEMQAEELEADS